MSLTILALLPEAAAVEVGAELGALLDRTSLEAVDPVRAKQKPNVNFKSHCDISFLLESRVWTDERAALTLVMAVSMLVTWEVRLFFSASEQVTEEDTPVISAASLVRSMAGNLVDFSMTMLQLL